MVIPMAAAALGWIVFLRRDTHSVPSQDDGGGEGNVERPSTGAVRGTLCLVR